MATSRAWLATIAMLSAATLAACDSEAAPPDRPTTTRSSTTSSTTPPTSDIPTDPAKRAPKVEDPLDDTEFVADPCSSLTPTQLTELQLSELRETDGEGEYQSEVGCAYEDLDPATDLFIYVNYYPDVTTGLGYLYAHHVPDPTPTPNWIPTTINGHPAVSRAPTQDPTRCQVDVGTSDTSYFNVTYYYYNGTYDWDGRDTCAAATSIAAAVLATMKTAN